MDQATWMRYWRRAIWLSGLLRCLPFVRMVGLNGSMVTGTFRPESDIDLYLVTKDGHIFLTRFLVTTFITLTGLRIKPNQEAGRFCPNRFAIESFVEITPHDVYHARVFHNLIPIFSDEGVYLKYRKANLWMAELGEFSPTHQPVFGHSLPTFIIQRTVELLLGWESLEKIVEQWQRGRIARDPRAHVTGSKVIVNSRELRFHLAKEANG